MLRPTITAAVAVAVLGCTVETLLGQASDTLRVDTTLVTPDYNALKTPESPAFAIL